MATAYPKYCSECGEQWLSNLSFCRKCRHPLKTTYEQSSSEVIKKELTDARLLPPKQSAKFKAPPAPEQYLTMGQVKSQHLQTQDEKDIYSSEVFVDSIFKYCTSDRDRDTIRNQLLAILKICGLKEALTPYLDVTFATTVCEDFDNVKNPDTCNNLKAFLRRLIMLDFTCRDQFDQKVVHTSEKVSSNVDFDFDAQFQPLDFSKQSNETHPLDHFLLVYLSSDLFLRQLLVQKAFLCRLAIPILYPSAKVKGFELTLWPLRFVNIEAKGDDNQLRDIDLASAKLPFISFCRVGLSHCFQKSRVINCLLSSNASRMHPTFHCWGEHNSNRARLISDGVVEGSWYLKANSKQKNNFSDSAMFLNLRGESEANSVQTDFLCKFSQVVVIVVEMQNAGGTYVSSLAKKIVDEGKQVIFLINYNKAGQDDKLISDVLPKFKNNLRSIGHSYKLISSFTTKGTKMLANVIEDLRLAIDDALRKGGPIEPVESVYMNACTALMGTIQVDESMNTCMLGKSLAEGIHAHVLCKAGSTMEEIKNHILKVKTTGFPLHDKLWKDYSHHEKVLRRSKDNISKKFARQKMRNIRDQQLDIVILMPEIMKCFIGAIDKSAHDLESDKIYYMLCWLKYFLEDLTRRTRPLFLDKYHQAWLALQKSKCNPKMSCDELKGFVEKAEEDLLTICFGHEHFLRELGQIYESAFAKCSSDDEELKELIGRFPKICAKIVLAGYPLEILNGDAANIPLAWLQGVFNEIKNILWKKKLFVVSILGIQSSGKSTLLNAMFGLQCTVSTARCTRGVYMQLLKVDKSKYLPFDYLCVIDTEGLRSNEVGQKEYDHDNELATLVIGLGDVTIINIKGENYAEMQDILEIVVHAFLRMKLASLDYQRCIFVHQNVASADAESKLRFGCQKLQENLDKMTTRSAIDEKRLDINTFSQVMKFDCHDDVYFFPDFWQENPPMGYVNPRYSEEVKNVRDRIFKELAGKKEGYFIHLDQFWTRINDIWNAIQQENFVFSFKNTLEVRAYTHFERKCRRVIIHKIEEFFIHWLDETALNDISNCRNYDELDNCNDLLMAQLESYSADTFAAIKDDIERIIEEDEYSNIIDKWKSDFVKAMKKKIKKECKNCIYEVGNAVKRRKAELIPCFEQTIYTKVCNAEDDAEDTYASIDQIINKFSEEVEEPSLSEDDIKLKIKHVLEEIVGTANEMDLNNEWEHVFELSISQDPDVEKLEHSLKVTEKDIHVATHGDRDQCLPDAYNTFEGVMRQVKVEIENLPGSGTFNCPKVRDIFDSAWQLLDETFKLENNEMKYHFTDSFRIRAMVHIAQYVYPVICQMEKNFYQEIQELKSTHWKIMHGVVKDLRFNDSESMLFTKNIAEHLTQGIVSLLHETICALVNEHFQHSYSSKEKIMHKAFLILSADWRPDHFKQYLENPDMYAIDSICKLEHDSFDEEKKIAFLNMAEPDISKTLKCLHDTLALDETQEPLSPNPVEIAKWLDDLIGKLNALDVHRAVISKLIMLHDATKLNNDTNSQIVNLKKFHRAIIENLPTSKSILRMLEFKQNEFYLGVKSMKEYINKMLGCKFQCPFCKEICKYDDEDHSSCHECKTHRPMGIAGRGDDYGALTLKTCNALIMTNDTRIYKIGAKKPKKDKFSNYKSYYPKWHIDNSDNDPTEYWQWFMVKYRLQIVKVFKDATAPEIPDHWKQAISPLDPDYVEVSETPHNESSYDQEPIYENISVYRAVEAGRRNIEAQNEYDF